MEWKWSCILRGELLHPKVFSLQVPLPEELWNLKAPRVRKALSILASKLLEKAVMK